MSEQPQQPPIAPFLIPSHLSAKWKQALVALLTFALSAMWIWAGCIKGIALIEGQTQAPGLASVVREQLRSSLLQIHPDWFFGLLSGWQILLGAFLWLSVRLKWIAATLSALTILVFTLTVYLADPDVLGEGLSCNCMEIGAFDVESMRAMVVRNAIIFVLSLVAAIAWWGAKSPATEA